MVNSQQIQRKPVYFCAVRSAWYRFHEQLQRTRFDFLKYGSQSDGQQITRFLSNPKFNAAFINRLALSHLSPVQTLTPYFYKSVLKYLTVVYHWNSP